MPVRNGAQHVASALTSLAGQDFGDFEVIISDNASDDETEEICRSIARSDRRIRYTRLPENIGAAQNFNRVLALARCRYFMWAAHDDRWDPTFVSRCLSCLQQHPDTVTCATGIERIDESNCSLGLDLDNGGVTSSSWSARATGIVARRDRHIGFGFYGLHRTEALRAVGPLGGQFGSDVLLTLRLAKLGRWCWVDLPLFKYRIRTEDQRSAAPCDPALSQDRRPVSSLVRSIWAELAVDAPGAGAILSARTRFLLAVCRPGHGWRTFLLMENGDLLRAAIAERDLHAVGLTLGIRLMLDPLGWAKRSNWEACRNAYSRPDQAFGDLSDG
ncbi:MAG: glycosyltransferase family 2 protein [Acidimicrobiales bacterium]